MNELIGPVAALKAARREARELRKYLKGLVMVSERHLAGIDAVMEGPSTVERGRKIAALCNELEMAKDMAKRFGLGLDFDGKPLKRGK